MDLIVIDSNSDEADATVATRVTLPAWRGIANNDAYAAVVRDALAMAAALADPPAAATTTKQKVKKITPKKNTKFKRLRADMERDGTTGDSSTVSARTTPAGSPSPPPPPRRYGRMGFASRKRTGEMVRSVAVAKAAGTGGRAVGVLQPPLPSPDIVDLLSSSDAGSAVENEAKVGETSEVDDNMVWSALARPSSPRPAPKAFTPTPAALMGSPARKRKRLRRFDRHALAVVEKKRKETMTRIHRTTMAPVRRSLPRTIKKKAKQSHENRQRQRHRPLSFRSVEATSSSSESTSSGIVPLGSGPPLSMSSSEEEWPMSLPSMRARLLSPIVTARKTAPDGSDSYALAKSRSYASIRKSAPHAGDICQFANHLSSLTANGRTMDSARSAIAWQAESMLISGYNSSSSSALPARAIRSLTLLDTDRSPQTRVTGTVAERDEIAPASSSPKRSRRQVEPRFNADSVPFKDLQAQEIELATIKAQRSMLASLGSVDTVGDANATLPGCPDDMFTMDLCSSSDESIVVSDHSIAGIDRDRGDRPVFSRSIVSSSVETSRPPHDDTAINVTQVSRIPIKMTRASRRPLKASSRPQTAWRDSIPTNVLDGNISRSFETLIVKPLTHFDASGELEQKCAFLTTFGQAGHLTSSTYAIESTELSETLDKKSTEEQVHSVLEQVLPQIRKCHEKRTNVIILESRDLIRANLLALSRHRALLVNATLRKIASSDKKRKSTCLVRGRTLPLTTSRKLSRNFVYRDDESRNEERIGQLVKIAIMPAVQPLSRSVTCVTLVRNFRVDDDPVVRFLPAPKDAAEFASRVAAQMSELKSKGVFDLPPSAVDDEVAECAMRAVVAQCGDRDLVFEALKKVAGLSQPYTEYSTLKKLHDSIETAQRRVAEAMRTISGNNKDGVGVFASHVAFKSMSQKSLSERLAPPLTSFDSHTLRWRLEQTDAMATATATDCGRRVLNVRRTGDYAAMMETYREFFCRICYCYDCQEHGIEQPQPNQRADPTYPRLKSQIECRKEMSEECCIAESEDDESTDGATREESDSVESAVSEENESDSEEIEQRRRSSRSLTVIATTATSNWELQEKKRRGRSRGSQRQQMLHTLDDTEYLDFSHIQLLSQTMKTLLTEKVPCGDFCWKWGHERDADTVHDESVVVLVKKLARLFGMRACAISAIVLSPPCRDVHTLLSEYERQEQDHQLGEFERTGRGRRPKGNRGQSSSISGNRDVLERSRNQREVNHANNHAYEPCDHEGPCVSAKCGCLRRDHYCEKACGCRRDCSNRFRGCKCGFGACRTSECPCYAAGRECDPDLCNSCGASEVALYPFSDLARLFNSADDQISTSPTTRRVLDGLQPAQNAPRVGRSQHATCANVHLLCVRRKKVAIGASQTHGWGAYAATRIRRGEFICEYPGELISQDEAERRGLVYDRGSSSYLFDLNEDAVVDAIRMGNKSRFINHEPVNPNCHAKVVRVGAEHRITIWGSRDIRQGEELFFDYRFKPECAPQWSRPQLSQGGE